MFGSRATTRTRHPFVCGGVSGRRVAVLSLVVVALVISYSVFLFVSDRSEMDAWRISEDMKLELRPREGTVLLVEANDGGTLFLNDTLLATVLKSIPVTPRDPAMCNNLLDCTLLFWKRYRKLPEQLGGSMVVATGDGRSYSLSMPMFNYKPAEPILVYHVLEAALNTSKPTVFFISSMDGDVFHKRHHCKSPEKDPLPLSLDFPFIFFLTSTGLYGEGGRLVPNSIPIPDPHSVIEGIVRREWMLAKLTQKEALASRPPKAIYFGATTGYSRDFGNGMSYSYADRFQVVDHLLGSNISQAYFINKVVQDVVVPSEYRGKDVSWPTWTQYGRYIIDVDGNANAWTSLKWKLCSGGPVIKVNSSSGYVQWYYHLLEHGVHIHLVDVFRQDLEEEVRRVMNDIPYATKLARNAASFCSKHLRFGTQMQYLRKTVATLWETPELLTRDWRIKSPPYSRLRPMVSPYVRYAPMKRISQALSVGGDVDAGRGVPTALLNLAKVIDIRTVCVFGTVFPLTLGKPVWVELFKSKWLYFKPTVTCSVRHGPCDLAVLLEDAIDLDVVEGDILGAVNKEYHVIVSMGMNMSTSALLRKSEVIVGEWPSVNGVVTQIQSVLEFPANYTQKPYFPCPRCQKNR